MSAVLVGLRRLVLLAALVAVVLGVGDQDGSRVGKLPQLDVVIVLDRTTSMSAEDDPAGSRIDAAARDLLAFSQAFRSARFTVVTVGSIAEVALPPTSDPVAFEALLTYLAVEPADVGSGSASDRAVPVVERRFEREAAEDDGVERLPVLVYVGDGEENGVADAPGFDTLGTELAGALVLGYGTVAGGPMPLVLGGQDPATAPTSYLVDPDTGQTAISHADPDRLAAIADQLGGTYLAPAGPEDAVAAADALQSAAYADLPPARPARQVGWAWGLLVLLLGLAELRLGWRGWVAARRAVRGR